MKARMIAAASLAIVLVFGLLIAVVSAQSATAAPTAAATNMEAPGRFADLLSAAKTSETAISFDFIVPIVTGERVWTLPDEAVKRTISAVGADYVCFSEPWNAGSRERCTPFSNISSITFLK